MTVVVKKSRFEDIFNDSEPKVNSSIARSPALLDGDAPRSEIDSESLPLEEEHSITRMVLNYICLGKGVILPYKLLVQKYFPELLGIEDDSYAEHDQVIDEVIKKQLGDQYEVITLGHDAFHQGDRHDLGLNNGPNEETYLEIQDWLKEKNQELIFIGKYKELTGIEMNSRPGASELLYSLTGFLPEIVDYYSKLLKEDLGSLKTIFDQTPQIWTFGTDCTCCS